ncbi:MAG: metalloregulator ArsR/SmtB family transcription factor [Bacteroidales bacterium]
MKKTEIFSNDLQDISNFARVLSHPARLSILQYLANCKSCISGDIADQLPLSRSTVSQHLAELKTLGLIQGTIEGLNVNYCLNIQIIRKYAAKMEEFLSQLVQTDINCNTQSQ